MRDFRSFSSTELQNVLNESLHSTEGLGLYSLNYLTQLIKDHETSYSKDQLPIIADLLKITLAHIEKWTLIPDRMKYNDHVVAARLESLILLKSFFKEQTHLSEETGSTNK